MLADRVPALRGWKAAAALPFADLATNAIGRQFVYAETIATALRRAERDACARAATRFSFDMLGEGARTDADADRNFRRTMEAIRAMERAVSARAAIWRERLEVSVKLSSIHARYDAASYAQVRGELLDRLKQIAGRAAAAGIGLTIDAEASESLSLQLDLFEALAADPALDRWGGLGLAVQAYQLRALGTVDALLEIAGRRRKRGGMPIAVRLVKGAYWDAEVKRAQELGLERYPVFTDKRLTDLSYLACARRLSSGLDSVYPQFATHNPVTLACVLVLADQLGGASAAAARFECQRLHGMDGRCTARSQLCIRICRCARMPGRREARTACLPRAQVARKLGEHFLCAPGGARETIRRFAAHGFRLSRRGPVPAGPSFTNGAAHAATTHCKGL